MTAIIADSELQRRLIRRRRARGEDHYDEVWDGIYVMNAQPNDEHQSLVSRMTFIFETVVGEPGLGKVRPGVNVSDRDEGWKENYRCPDVVVFLNGTTAVNRNTHWVGGPDFAVEICSPYDRTREMFEFYARVTTRELLVIDRNPWSLELYRLNGAELRLAGRTEIDSTIVLQTEDIPLKWRLVSGPERPLVHVECLDESKHWLA